MPATIAGFGAILLPLWHCVLNEIFLSAHVEYLQRIANRSRHKTDVSRALASKKHLDSFIGRDGNFSVLRRPRRPPSYAQVFVRNSNSVSSTSSRKKEKR
jgi:hypothetical protein